MTTVLEKLSGEILVMDSGLGGLSILNALQKHLPNESFIYFADYAYLPYGEKNPEIICKRCCETINYFLEKYQLKAVVIACNSATAAAIKYLRTHYDVAFFGIEPAIKPAAKQSQTGIAVLATELTLNSEQFHQLELRYAQGKPIHRLAAPELVELVEHEDIINNKAQVLTTAKDVLSRIDKPFDTLLLGCTHFSFLQDTFKHLLPETVQIIDTSEAISTWVYQKLKQDKHLQQKPVVYKSTQLALYCSGKPEVGHKNLAKLEQYTSKDFSITTTLNIEV